MSDEVPIGGGKYISSKRASELSGYAQDYIGQLARAGAIDAKRIGGLWYVSFESLSAYKNKSDEYKPEIIRGDNVQPAGDAEAIVTFDGRDHISASRAAKITGYHQDYIGQLARSGKIPSRQIGNRWYVERSAIEAHKNEKDGLLAAVQAQSAGLTKNDAAATSGVPHDSEPFYTYVSESRDLMANLTGDSSNNWTANSDKKIPIRIVRKAQVSGPAQHREYQEQPSPHRPVSRREKAFSSVHAVAALTVVVVLALGYFSFKNSSLYTTDLKIGTGAQNLAQTGSASDPIATLAEWIEDVLATQVTYTREQ